MIVDLFAGPGGWAEGCRMAGLSEIGIEMETDPLKTRLRAGHETILSDVGLIDPIAFRGLDGLLASPPCQAFSAAGRGEGRRKIREYLEHVSRCRAEWIPWEGEEKIPPILQPLRWAWKTSPRWLAFEQVTPVVPLWERMALILRRWGYEAGVVKILAADYGIPQTRRRAFLLAHREKLRVPRRTHIRIPRLLPLEPWIAMMDVLLLPPGTKLRTAGHTREGDRTRLRPRTAPAPTIAFGHARMDWIFSDGTETPMSISQAAVLQSFPENYPFYGGIVSQRKQVADAVPPLLARRIVETLTAS